MLGPRPRAEPYVGSTALGWSPESPLAGVRFQVETSKLGRSPRAEPYVGSTASAEAGPRKTPPVGVTLKVEGTSVAPGHQPAPG